MSGSFVRTRSERVWGAVELLIVVTVLALLSIPLLVILPISFSAGSMLVLPTPGWSLQWYEEVLTTRLWQDAAANSFYTATVATVLATTLGTLAALGIHQLGGWPKRLLSALALAPLLVPIAIIAVSSFFFFAWAGLVRTYTGIILELTVLAMPYVVITVGATLQKYDANLNRAAASLGASPLSAFMTVMLPIIAPGIVAGALFAFVVAFDEVVIVLFIAAPEQQTLPRVIYSGIRENISPAVAAAAVMLCAVSMLLMFAAELIRRRTARLRSTGI